MNPQDNTSANLGNPQQQVIERLKTAVNVLVTVSNSPSVDQLAAAVGFTLMLNKMGKHATAVYSGDTPSTIEFLSPASTIEKNTDSLRDFIVSLDKSKADKLRYKVEDNVVKIFITPYRTSLTDKDLNFSQGDFNVDAVIALGVSEREELDQAIIAHGRILHDATVITVSAGDKVSTLGAVNWQDTSASSLCEMLVSVGEVLQPGNLDNQIATAYLTGIVAQTERFRNIKTTPKIMTMSAQLMAAGANQQLIAASLEEVPEPAVVAVLPAPEEAPVPVPAAESPDGSLTIKHEEEPERSDPSTESGLNLNIEVEQEKDPDEEDKTNQIAIDEHGIMSPAEEKAQPASGRRLLIEPLPEQAANQSGAAGDHPLTAFNSDDGENEPNSDPLSVPQPGGLAPNNEEPGSTLPPIPSQNEMPQPEVLSEPVVLPPAPKSPMMPVEQPAPKSAMTLPPAFDNDTLRDIEKTFDSNHIALDPTSTLDEIERVEHSPHQVEVPQPVEGLDSARDAVMSAINAAPYDPTRPQPLQSLNAAPFDMSTPLPPTSDPVLAGLGLTDQATSALSVLSPAPTPTPPSEQQSFDPTTAEFIDPSGQSPPPVPPPLMPLQ